MKILITGATGLVGLNIIKALREESGDYIIYGQGRDRKILSDLKSSYNIIPIPLDLTASIDRFQDKLGTVTDTYWIHCAAAISGAQSEVLEAVNIDGTRKLLNIAKQQNCKQFILISSVSTYPVTEDGPFSENDNQAPPTPYGQSKLIQEELVINSGIPYTIFRPPFIAGPQDTNFLKEFADRIRDQNMPSFGKPGVIGIVDVRDLGCAVIEVLDNDIAINEDYNIQSISIEFDDFIDKFGFVLGVEHPYGPSYPYWLMYIIAALVDLKGKITGQRTERGLSLYRLRGFTGDRSLAIDKIQQAIGYKSSFTSVEAIVKDWEGIE